MNLNNVQSFPNGSGAAVVAYRVMAFDGSGNLVYGDKDTANVRLAGSALQDRGATDLDPIDISLFNCGGVHYMMAGGAIAKGAEIELGDDGKIVTQATLAARGIALESASGDGAVINVYVYPAAAPTRGEGALPAVLTDSTGGTANGTLVAIPATTPADLAAQGVINGNIRDNLADLAAKVNAIIAYLG